jgi:transcriptional regulator with XRE-family HTH domain
LYNIFMIVDKNVVAKNISKYRKLSGLTQQELAEKTGLTKRTIAYYESGKYNITLKNIGQISEALNINIATLLNNKKSETNGVENIDVRWLKKIYEIKKLPINDQKAIVKYINMLIEKHNIK